MNTITYTITENLLQAIAGTLNQIPAGQSRHLLNAIEAECKRQDDERAEKAEAEKRAAIIAEVTHANDPT